MNQYKNHQLNYSGGGGAIGRCRPACLIAATLLIAASASVFADAYLGLTLTGPKTAASGYPVEGITVKLVNQDATDAPASRLRVFVHDELDRDLKVGDIKIDVLEGGDWQALSLEPIDGGVMAAIGSAGLLHDNYHEKGGFPIDKKTIKEWRLRVTLALAGHYSLVVAVSPDNGSTHLAPPASLKLEAL
ncbi:MAG: hypothetical protein ACKN9F_00695 [Methylomonas sp.]